MNNPEVDSTPQTQHNHAEYYQSGMALADHYAAKGQWGRVEEIIVRLMQHEREWLAMTKRLQELARRSIGTKSK